MISITKCKADLKQFGFGGFLKRTAKFFLNKVGINVNSYYYMVNHIDAVKNRKQFEAAHIPPVKELTYDDFLKGDKSVFNEKKLTIIQEWLSEGTYKAYGIIENDILIYSCWISLYIFETSDVFIHGCLDNDEGLLFSAYCNSSARGRGLHGAMNAYRLWQLAQNNKKQAVVIILKENKPAYKSQLKVGFEVAFTYYVVTVWGKTYTNYYKRKKTYIENAGK